MSNVVKDSYNSKLH